MTALREAKQAVRAYIRTWSDEKLAAVYAFNEDGRMADSNQCCCLVGVGSSEFLHTRFCGQGHYSSEKYGNALADKAELGYMYLKWADGAGKQMLSAERQQRHLSAILRAEMRLRDRRREFISTADLAALESLALYEEAVS